mgnify:FL=1
MADLSKEIIGKLNQLIDLAATDPKMEKTAKLRFIRLLLALKLDFLGFLAKKEVVRPTGKREKTKEKERLILKFIEEKGGRAGMEDLAILGISGRSLRRYLKNLSKQGLITLEKRGREHFYLLLPLSEL